MLHGECFLASALTYPLYPMHWSHQRYLCPQSLLTPSSVSPIPVHTQFSVPNPCSHPDGYPLCQNWSANLYHVYV